MPVPSKAPTKEQIEKAIKEKQGKHHAANGKKQPDKKSK